MVRFKDYLVFKRLISGRLNAIVGEVYRYIFGMQRLCEGGELLDRILSKKDSRYSEKDAAQVVRQMLKVAAECHLNGLVHRDLKPEVHII